jgi:hypothetical protein
MYVSHILPGSTSSPTHPLPLAYHIRQLACMCTPKILCKLPRATHTYMPPQSRNHGGSIARIGSHLNSHVLPCHLNELCQLDFALCVCEGAPEFECITQDRYTSEYRLFVYVNISFVRQRRPQKQLYSYSLSEHETAYCVSKRATHGP